MPTSTDSTLLSISGIELGDYSCRGLTMTLTPTGTQGALRRTVNGSLIDLSAPQFRKFAATISCEDQEAPELTDIWQGQEVTVTCIPGLGVAATSGELTMTMMVDSWTVSRDEWGCLSNWSINLLEV